MNWLCDITCFIKKPNPIILENLLKLTLPTKQPKMSQLNALKMFPRPSLILEGSLKLLLDTAARELPDSLELPNRSKHFSQTAKLPGIL